MRTITYISLVALLAVCLGGCLTTGQITINESFGNGVTTSTIVYSYDLDLNDNEDYVDNKDKIKSIDGVGVVAIVKNNLQTAAQAEIYVSDDPTLEDVADITDPKQTTLVFVSPEIAGNATLKIGWADAFAHVVNEQAIIDQIIGDTADGMFTIYVVGNVPNFDLTYKAEVTIVLTVEL